MKGTYVLSFHLMPKVKSFQRKRVKLKTIQKRGGGTVWPFVGDIATYLNTNCSIQYHLPSAVSTQVPDLAWVQRRFNATTEVMMSDLTTRSILVRVPVEM